MALEKLAKTPALLRKIGQVGDTRPFYSPVDKAISEITQNKATGEQMLAALLKTKGVAKELKDRPAIKKALEQPKITKQELERVAAEHPPAQIEESRSSGTFNQLEPTLPKDGSLELVEDPPSFSGNRYPYGVRDTKTGDIIGYGTDEGDAILDVYSGYPQYWGKHAQHEQRTIPGGENYREILLKLPKGEGDVFKTSHFEGEPNILAHARVTDRTGPNGEKILHVEEIQSDWHQAGRDARNNKIKSLMQSEGIDKATASKRVPEDYGYKTNQRQAEYVVDKGGYYEVRDQNNNFVANVMHYDMGNNVTPENALVIANSRILSSQIGRQADDPRVPDAPFKQNWHELVMKRLLDDAARNGYDKVVITPGAKQAERYNLAKQVDEVIATRNEDGTFNLSATMVGGGGLEQSVGKNISADKLPDYVGKDLAKSIQEQGFGTDVYNGDQLKVGGEGMKGFYDQILPSYLNNYGKPYGSRVGEYTMPEVATPLHSFDITPQMREDIIGKGLPLYQVAPVGIGAGAAMQGEQPEGYGAGGAVKKAAKALFKAPQDEALRLAQQRAALPVERGGLGLPPNNTAKQRAAAMGFDTNVYHGTTQDIRAFDISRAGSSSEHESAKIPAVWTTRRPEVANIFTAENFQDAYPVSVHGPAGGGLRSIRVLKTLEGGNVMPLMLRGTPEETLAAGQAQRLIFGAKSDDWRDAGSNFSERFNEKPVLTKIKGHPQADLEFRADQYVVPDPSMLRSRFAAFDPWRRNAATAAAMGVAAPDLLAEEKKAKGGSVSKDAIFMAVMNKKLKGKKNA